MATLTIIKSQDLSKENTYNQNMDILGNKVCTFQLFNTKERVKVQMFSKQFIVFDNHTFRNVHSGEMFNGLEELMNSFSKSMVQSSKGE